MKGTRGTLSIWQQPNLMIGRPSDGPTLGRYLALRAGAIYEAAWVEWADIAIQAISGGDSR